MPKDYAKLSRKKAASSKSTPSWRRRLLIVIGILFVVVAIYVMIQYKGALWHQRQAAPISGAEPAKLFAQQALQQVIRQPGAVSPPPSQARIEFHGNDAVTVATKSYFILQLASFDDRNQAETLQRRLKKLAYSPHLLVYHQGEKKIYRLQMGPYKTQQQALQIQQKLYHNKVNSLLVKKSTEE